jgi:uncharacterized membrane protein
MNFRNYKKLSNFSLQYTHLLIPFFLFILAILLRYPAIERDSLWLDEAWRLQLFSAQLNTVDLKVFISQVFGFDGVIRLIVNLFGASEWTLRGVSFISGVLAIPTLYFLGYKITGKILISLVASFLLAINPWHISYSSEMAPYALGSFLFPLFLIALIRLYENNNNSSLVISILIGVALSVMHLYFFVLTVICTFLLIVINWDRASFKNKVILIFIIIFLLNIFQIMPFFSLVETDEVSMRYNINWTVGFPLKVLNAITSGPIPNRFVSTISYMPFGYILIFYSVTVLTSLLFIRSFIYSIKLNNKIAVFVIYSTLLYVLFIYLQGHIVNGAFIRYLMPVVPVLFLIVTYVMVEFANSKPKYYKYIIFVFSFYLLNYGLALYHEAPGEKYKPKYRNFFASFIDECSVNKVFFLNPNFTEIPIFNFYLKDTDCNVVEQPAFRAYFEDKRMSMLNDDELVYKKQDKWMAKEIVKLLDEKANVYVVARRSQIRTYNMVQSTGRLFEKIIDSEIPDLLILKLK